MTIDTQIKEAEATIAKLRAEKLKQIGQMRFKCWRDSCGKITRLEDVVLLRHFYYVQPYSCTGGGYYSFSEYGLVCPHCSMRHRLIEPKSDNNYDFEKQQWWNFYCMDQITSVCSTIVDDYNTLEILVPKSYKLTVIKHKGRSVKQTYDVNETKKHLNLDLNEVVEKFVNLF